MTRHASFRSDPRLSAAALQVIARPQHRSCPMAHLADCSMHWYVEFLHAGHQSLHDFHFSRHQPDLITTRGPACSLINDSFLSIGPAQRTNSGCDVHRQARQVMRGRVWHERTEC